TGSILYVTKFCNSFTRHINASRAFGIGLAQAFAILPGISRSGSTISLGLYLGIERKEVANFSFLMVIPVIAGTMMLATKDIVVVSIQTQATWSLVVIFLTVFISGYFSFIFLIILRQSKGIHPFLLYCWLLGAVCIIFFW